MRPSFDRITTTIEREWLAKIAGRAVQFQGFDRRRPSLWGVPAWESSLRIASLATKHKCRLSQNKLGRISGPLRLPSAKAGARLIGRHLARHIIGCPDRTSNL